MDRLTEIKTPTQILVGDNDLTYYHTIADILADKIKDSNLEYIGDSGHMVNLENEVEYNKALKDFIEQNE